MSSNARRGEVRLTFEADRLTMATASQWPSHDRTVTITIGTESVEITSREAAKLARWLADALGVVNHVG